MALPIGRIVSAAIRSNPVLAISIALELGLVVARAVKKAADRNAARRRAKSIEATLVDVSEPKPRSRPSQSRRRRTRG
jgi:RNase P protein component